MPNPPETGSPERAIADIIRLTSGYPADSISYEVNRLARKALAGLVPPPGLRDAVRLLGQQVRVKLSDQHVATGKLLRVSAMGEFVLEDEMGDVLWCWPLLSIEPDADPQGSLISGSGVPEPPQ